MKIRPILFSAPMVRALLDGTKTQTRRILKPQPGKGICEMRQCGMEPWIWNDGCDTYWDCPYGQPGDRLYVKEAAFMWCEIKQDGKTKTGRPKICYIPMREAPIHYHADHPHKPLTTIVSPAKGEWGWRLKIGRFMPRWASRITLEITNVRVERLQDISDEDALAEGVVAWAQVSCSLEYLDDLIPQGAFELLWCSINGRESWDANPWVWVIGFKKLDTPHVV